jgi:hypothetical protein
VRLVHLGDPVVEVAARREQLLAPGRLHVVARLARKEVAHDRPEGRLHALSRLGARDAALKVGDASLEVRL